MDFHSAFYPRRRSRSQTNIVKAVSPVRPEFNTIRKALSTRSSRRCGINCPYISGILRILFVNVINDCRSRKRTPLTTRYFPARESREARNASDFVKKRKEGKIKPEVAVASYSVARRLIKSLRSISDLQSGDLHRPLRIYQVPRAQRALIKPERLFIACRLKSEL